MVASSDSLKVRCLGGGLLCTCVCVQVVSVFFLLSAFFFFSFSLLLLLGDVWCVFPQLFEPEELELVICGSSEIDFEALEEAAVYEEPLDPDGQLVTYAPVVFFVCVYM